MTPAAIATVRMTGTSRHNSHKARATLSLAGGWKVRVWSASTAVRRNRTGGLPNQEVPDLALAGVADNTATREFFGTLRPAAVMPELPRKERFPILAGAIFIQPPPSS